MAFTPATAAAAIAGANLTYFQSTLVGPYNDIIAGIVSTPAAWIDTTANRSTAPTPGAAVVPGTRRRALRQASPAAAAVASSVPLRRARRPGRCLRCAARRRPSAAHPAPGAPSTHALPLPLPPHCSIYSTVYTDSPFIVASAFNASVANGQLAQQLQSINLTLVPNSAQAQAAAVVPSSGGGGGSSNAVAIAVPIAVVCGVLGIGLAGFAGWKYKQRKNAEAAEAEAAAGGELPAGMQRAYGAAPGAAGGAVQLAANPEFRVDPLASEGLHTPGTASPAVTASLVADESAGDVQPPAQPARGVGANLP